MIDNKYKLQEKFCKEKGYPVFVPNDGICWSCNGDVFSRYTEYECERQLITGCLHCKRSFCD